MSHSSRNVSAQGSTHVLWATLCLAVLCGCGGVDPRVGEDAGGDDRGNSAGSNTGDNTGPGGALDVVSVALEPPLAELESVDGARVSQQFRLIGTREDGSTLPLYDAGFEVEALALGAIDDETGLFVASGIRGGETRVRARAKSEAGGLLEAEATLRVHVSRTLSGANVPPEAGERFAQTAVTDASRAASVVYPLQGAVMPQNVFPADVQWLRGAQDDLFEVRLDKPNASVRVVLHAGAGFGNHYLVDAAAWRMLAQSDPDAPVMVRVRRWQATTGELVEATPRSFSFARAALTGSIYYWDIEAGRIVRINGGTNKAVQFMPTPPEGAPGEAGCVGCHAVSPSGRYMAVRLSGGNDIAIGATFDLTTDLTASPPPTLFPVVPSFTGSGSAQWWFSSWSPDETRLVVTTEERTTRRLAMFNPFSGAAVTVTGAMPGNATHPAWSPDGKAVAYVANANAFGGQLTAGDIAVLPVTAKDTVGKPELIHAGATLSTATPAGSADSYPSWTPDSSQIAFGHGTGSRSEDQLGALYMMARDGGGVVRLDKACGGAKQTDNFQPRFSPFDSGGYYWLSFLSRRDYGNTIVGTRGKHFQQIWVTAIKKNPAPGEDPSQVAYWIAGQSTASRNISAYWAPRPCRKDNQSCSVGSECCGGDCRPDAEGALVCSPPPAESCRKAGETCSGAPDCCGGLLCDSNVCIIPIQ